MIRQTRQHSMTEQDSVCLGFPRVGSEAQAARSESRGLPTFVSAAPPRSEGEALLRRIFSRGER
ncbi:hypothetical protein [Archangium lansingense]|uniref:Uncharacterized protein n=1 Tax=Archangium lansingense TaxID=2995310 RepID=A0ABT4AMF2_9BACT|nr:hypothetical protein [Archangium lansinium]MCY1082875.1 hypothetical protein [Archangium lansinium]